MEKNKVFWKPWIPVSKTSMQGDYVLEDISGKSDDLIIILSSDFNKLIITFNGFPWSYRVTNESYRLLTFDVISRDKNHKNLFIEEPSEYANWINRESFGIYKDQDMIHYVITGSDWIIDVIDTEEPKVEVVKK